MQPTEKEDITSLSNTIHNLNGKATELVFYKQLQDLALLYGWDIVRAGDKNFPVVHCKRLGNKRMKADFYIPQLNMIIELKKSFKDAVTHKLVDEGEAYKKAGYQTMLFVTEQPNTNRKEIKDLKYSNAWDYIEVQYKQVRRKQSFGERFFVEPFVKSLEHQQLGVVQLINAATGTGKTHHMYETFIPTLLEEKRANLILVGYPSDEIFDQKRADKLVNETDLNILHMTPQDFRSKSKQELKTLLNLGVNIFIHATFSMIYTHGVMGRLIELTKELDELLPAYFADEIHQWHTSSQTNYRKNTGNSNSTYQARAYPLLEELIQITPYVYGMTATCTPEQTHSLPMLSELKYNTIITPAPAIETWRRRAWIGDITFDRRLNWHGFSKFTKEWVNRVDNIGELSMMIKCNNANSDQFTPDEVIHFLLNNHDELGIRYKAGDYTVARLDAKFHTIYSPTHKRGKRVTREEMKLKLRDPNDPLTFLVVKNLGASGLDIPNMKGLACLRKTNKKDITTISRQTFGRMERVNEWFVDNENNIKSEWISDLEKFDYLVNHNKIDMYVPDNIMWRKTLEQANEFTFTVDQVKETLGLNRVKSFW